MDNLPHAWRVIDGESRTHFLSSLRNARLAAQRDAEAFDELLFTFERLGLYCLREAKALGQYKAPLIDLARQSSLGRMLEQSQVAFHSNVIVLYKLVNESRNDALHQGARARHLTEHAIELGLILEDALMNSETNPMQRVSDIMVRSVTTAEPWQPVSFIRQVMLTNSYSYLPIWINNRWMLVSDKGIAAYLRRESVDSKARNQRLAKTISEAEGDALVFEEATLVSASTNLLDASNQLLKDPLLLIVGPLTESGTNAIVGIVTAFDLL